MGVILYDKELSLKQDRVAATPDMRAQRAAVLEKLALVRSEHVLEVGCGNGRFVDEMSAVVGDDGQIIGVDASKAMVPLAQAAFPDREFHLADLTALPFPDSRFDAVTSAQVLSYVEDIQTGLAEIYRVLKPGGRLVMLDTDWRSIRWDHPDPALMQRAIDLMLEVYADAYLSDTLAEKLSDAGFQNVEPTHHAITNNALEADTYSWMLIDFIEPAIRNSKRFAAQEAVDWVDGLGALNDMGAYRFTVNRSIFSAHKPS